MNIYKNIRHLIKSGLENAGLFYIPNGKPSQPTIELIDVIALTMKALSEDVTKTTLVQIGASDGTTHDFVNPFVKKLNINAILLEPMPHQFQRLKEAYKNTPRARCINAAMSDSSGLCTMYRVRPDGMMKNSYFVDTLASLDYSHLIKHRIPPREIQEIQVPCITLNMLYQQENLTSVDILVVDAEGFDARIITSALSMEQTPRYIIFENLHISRDDKIELYSLLDKQEYRYIHGFRDTLAIKGDLLADFTTIVESF